MMSLFGAKSTFQKAKDRLEKKMREEAETEGSTPEESVAIEESSPIGRQLEILGRGPLDPDGSATTFEIVREGVEEEEQAVAPNAITLPREVFNRVMYDNNRRARETGHPSQIMSLVLGPAPCDQL